MKNSVFCWSVFVYHYSNHFTAPRHVNMIDLLAFPAFPDLINPEKETTNVTTFPIFSSLCGLAPPQGTSHHWFHSVIYNWLLCPGCYTGPTQSRWTMSKSSRWVVPTSLCLPPAAIIRSTLSKYRLRTPHYSGTRVHPLSNKEKFLTVWLDTFEVVTRNTVARKKVRQD